MNLLPCVAFVQALSMAAPMGNMEPHTYKPHKSIGAKVVDSFRNSVSKFCVLTDHAEEFLSAPSLAKIERNDPVYDYYLMGLHCNIPMIKPGLFAKYNFIRFEGQIILKGESGEQGLAPNILSIYPTNSAMTVQVQDTSLVEAKFSPQWNGVGAGSISGENTRTANYSYQIPVITGISTQGGWVRWCWYSTKQQNVLFGNRSMFLLLQIPKGLDQHNIVFDGHLRYATNFTLPLMTAKYDRACSVDIRMATSLDDMLSSHQLEVGNTLVQGIKNVFEKETKK